MQGHAAILIRRPRKYGMHEFAEQFVLGVEIALRLPEYRHRDGREALILEEPLMRRRVIGLYEDLVALL